MSQVTFNYKRTIRSVTVWFCLVATSVFQTRVVGSTTDFGLATSQAASTKTVNLAYAPAPIDNPLKGLVPYQHEIRRKLFPHSMTFEYFALRDLMTGTTNFDWRPLDTQINIAANEGIQFGFQVYLDYPRLKTGIPQFLLDDGLKTIKYSVLKNNNISVMPDYENPELLMALTNFIGALGRRYDGDPKVGFINAGLLGFWGEWHCGSNLQRFASASVRAAVLNAYESAFHQTKILVRYPGVENRDRPFGYHDDSFCWDTLGSQKWTFAGQMTEAGSRAVNKWKTQPIGGELRPELWFCIWDDPTCAPTDQDFVHCVEATHASWIRDSGVFEKKLVGTPRLRALDGSRKLGYEFYVSSVTTEAQKAGLKVSLTTTNTGVAPFYYDWPIELAAATAKGRILKTWGTPWHITGILPNEPPRTLSMTLSDIPRGEYVLLLRVVNPLRNGKALRFANVTQDKTASGWLTLDHLE